jgi:hypothetical protein
MPTPAYEIRTIVRGRTAQVFVAGAARAYLERNDDAEAPGDAWDIRLYEPGATGGRWAGAAATPEEAAAWVARQPPE